MTSSGNANRLGEVYGHSRAMGGVTVNKTDFEERFLAGDKKLVFKG